MSDNPVAAPAYLTLDVRYLTLIMPIDKAAELLTLLQFAEKWDDSKYNDPRIVPIPVDSLRMSFVSKDEYLRVKTMALLDPQTP